MSKAASRRSSEAGDPFEALGHLELINAEFRRQIAARDRQDADSAREREYVRALFDRLPDYLYVKDAEGRFIMANRALAKDVGYPAGDDLRGKTDFDIHERGLAERFFAIEQDLFRTGEPVPASEERVIDAAGREKWVSTIKMPLRDPDGEIVGLVGIGRDITEQKRVNDLRKGEADVLAMVAMNAPLPDILDRLVRLIEGQVSGIRGSILLFDEDGRTLRHGAAPNLPGAYIAAINGSQIGPKSGSCGTAVFRREPVIVTDILSDPLWDNYRLLAIEFGLRSCWSTPVLSHDGRVLGSFAMYSSEVRAPTAWEMGLFAVIDRIASIAIERKNAEDQIQFMAHHDALTGLPNRALLADRLRQAMRNAERNDTWVTVAFIDLDDFKLINDSLGHGVGDQLLTVVARRMAEAVRTGDTVVRLGGDEFVVLLCDQPKDITAITGMLQRIRDAIAEPVQVQGKGLHVTSSVGLAIFPGDATDPEALVMAADAAMYDAKAAGRDNFQFYRPEMDTKVRERMSLQEHLRKAIAGNEFELHYQPQVDLRSGLVVGMEALLRWNSPELGIVPPNKFIPLAEATGLIVPIGDWVLATACRQNKAWQEAGLPPVRICVNASARQFRERTWVDRVEKALRESGLETAYLELEVTESLLLQDFPRSLENMKKLCDLGVQLSIDDFGTGYSNLSTLKDYPVARLKIDQSFIRDLPDDRENGAIVAAVISLAQRLELRVVAEGVETDRQLDFLRRHGCDEIQGDRLCQPLPKETAAEFLAIRSAVATAPRMVRQTRLPESGAA